LVVRGLAPLRSDRLVGYSVRYTFIVADFHRLLLAGLTGAQLSKPGSPCRRRSVGSALVLGISGTRLAPSTSKKSLAPSTSLALLGRLPF
jgi:hypothetical protein